MLLQLSKYSASFVSKMIRRSITSESIASEFRQIVPIAKPLTARQLVKPFVFTVSVCTSFSVAAIIWEHENKVKINKKILNFFKNPNLQNSAKKVATSHNDTDSTPPLFWGMAILNVGAFLAWKHPRMVPFMSRYFVCQVEPKSIRCLPMVLSNFSHKSAVHLAVNLLFLYETSFPGVYGFGKEHFLALYLGSGVCASFASYVYRVAFQSLVPSLGASGAILGVLAAILTMHPNIEWGGVYFLLAFIPTKIGFRTLCGFEAEGALLAFLELFHLAEHFGGTLFGVLSGFTIKKMYQKYRIKILSHWLNLKAKLFGNNLSK